MASKSSIVTCALSSVLASGARPVPQVVQGVIKEHLAHVCEGFSTLCLLAEVPVLVCEWSDTVLVLVFQASSVDCCIHKSPRSLARFTCAYKTHARSESDVCTSTTSYNRIFLFRSPWPCQPAGAHTNSLEMSTENTWRERDSSEASPHQILAREPPFTFCTT